MLKNGNLYLIQDIITNYKTINISLRCSRPICITDRYEGLMKLYVFEGMYSGDIRYWILDH